MGSRSATIGLGALLCAFCAAGAASAACSDSSVELRSGEAIAQFHVEIADTADERAVGLMNRDSLPSSAGMLFVYDTPGRASFWMKNTLIPLDLIFIDETGRVTRVHAQAKPRDETPIDGGEGVAMVLEINGGLAKRLDIKAGSVLRHPAIDQATAVWACDSE